MNFLLVKWPEIMKNDKGVLIGEFVYVNGEANGSCKLYNEDGILYFEGYLKNGYREGYGVEYDIEGNVIFEGLYKEGMRTNIIAMKEMKGYFKELNGKGELLSICEKNKNYENDGICYFYSNGVIDRISEYKNGKEISDSGYCRIYDEPHHVFFEGHFEDGKREGKGKEIDLNGEVVFDGFYSNGRRMNIFEMKEMKGYWKEVNEEGELISICHKNKKYENDGICYFYSNSKIDKVSEWKNGKEVNVLKRFEGNKMTEYKNGMMIYKGGYLNNIESDYARHGMGEEYGRKGKIVYKGEYDNGKRPSNMELCCKRSCKCSGRCCWTWIKLFFTSGKLMAILVLLWFLLYLAGFINYGSLGRILYSGIYLLEMVLLGLTICFSDYCKCRCVNDDCLICYFNIMSIITIIFNILFLLNVDIIDV